MRPLFVLIIIIVVEKGGGKNEQKLLTSGGCCPAYVISRHRGGTRDPQPDGPWVTSRPSKMLTGLGKGVLGPSGNS